jgi:hypothetical protein
MKRSEMIKHIAAELQVIACVVEGPNSINMPRLGYFQRRAAGLLDIIERLGMQPPPYTFKQKVVNNPTGDTISVIDYEWEDEG